MSRPQRAFIFAAVLFVVVLASAIGLVYSKHESRKLFVELEQTNMQIVSLNNEWGRLQLEQSAWSDHGRIERIARTRLGMKVPDANEVVFIKP
jgi:cell division protein FtsL